MHLATNHLDEIAQKLAWLYIQMTHPQPKTMSMDINVTQCVRSSVRSTVPGPGYGYKGRNGLEEMAYDLAC